MAVEVALEVICQWLIRVWTNPSSLNALVGCGPARLCCCCAKQEDTQRDGKRRSGSHRQSFSMWTYLCISCAKVNSCWWEFHNLLLKFRSERWQNEGKSGNICFFTGIYLPKKKEMITILSEILQSNVHTEDSKADAMCCSYEGWSWYNSVLRGP